MVVRVGDDHSVRARHGDVVGMLQLARFVAHRPELAHERSVRLEHLESRYRRLSWNAERNRNGGAHLNSVVFLVTDVDEAQGVCGYAPRVVETTVRGSLAAEGSQESSRGIEHLEITTEVTRLFFRTYECLALSEIQEASTEKSEVIR